MIISHCYLTSGSSIKSQVLDLKTLPIFSPLKTSVNGIAINISFSKNVPLLGSSLVNKQECI